MERRHEPTRLEGFSDAVFGFALTLLVVSLEVPSDVGQLVELMKGFLPFALMFAMICWIWYEHQQFFRNYALQDPWIIAVNCLLLFVILFYVYPLKFLTVGLVGWLTGMKNVPNLLDHSDVVMLAYSSGVVLIFGCFVLMYRHAWSKRDTMQLTAGERVTLRYGMRGHIFSALFGVASLILLGIGWIADVNFMPFFAGIIYSLMGPVHAMNGYQAGKAHTQLQKADTAPNAKR